MTQSPIAAQKKTGWTSLEQKCPPQNVEVSFLSKAGMETKGIMKGGKGWCDGIRSTGFRLYPNDYLVAWRPL